RHKTQSANYFNSIPRPSTCNSSSILSTSHELVFTQASLSNTTPIIILQQYLNKTNEIQNK
ncbi:hypothetical protein LINGRAHAP2_LOCUS34628, partial [Linum grandiflorum]